MGDVLVEVAAAPPPPPTSAALVLMRDVDGDASAQQAGVVACKLLKHIYKACEACDIQTINQTTCPCQLKYDNCWVLDSSVP
jgi:hypothetical protein